jgi:hypothetical protein
MQVELVLENLCCWEQSLQSFFIHDGLIVFYINWCFAADMCRCKSIYDGKIVSELRAQPPRRIRCSVQLLGNKEVLVRTFAPLVTWM